MVDSSLSDLSVAETLIVGLTAPISDAEREAARVPPYPTPVIQMQPRDRIVAELNDRLPEVGDGPLVATKLRNRPRPYSSVVGLLSQNSGVFEFSDAACALLAIGALSTTDAESILRHIPSHSGFRRQLVRHHLTEGTLEQACSEAERIPDGYAWTGYRDIADVLANQGDFHTFFKLWKHYHAKESRDEMTRIKKDLVQNVAKTHGWKAALKLTDDKRLGPKFVIDVFAGLLEAQDINQLRELLNGEAAGVLSEMDELTLLVAALQKSTDKDPDVDHPMLGHIADRIIAIDPTTDKATMRWRDWQLFSLWPACGSQATLDRIRKAVRTPNLKRELTRLPRDIRPNTK